MTRTSTLGLSDGPTEKNDGNKKCPHCDGFLQENIGYDTCPTCGRHLKESRVRVVAIGDPDFTGTDIPIDVNQPDDEWGMKDIQPPDASGQEWQCPQCESWNPGSHQGTAWHDCPNCGWSERHPTDIQGHSPESPHPSRLTGKYRVVALGEMQQPGGVGATQTAGPVNGSPQADDDPTEPGISTDAGQNSYEQNNALQTWVNFAVDMLNRGKQEHEVLAQLAHDGCPDPKGVLTRALEQPEEAPVPNEGAEDPFDVPFRNEQTAQEESVSQQPPVVQSLASWQPDPRRIERHSTDHIANKYIEERDGKWVITQKGTGKVLSEHDSQDKAEASFRAMEMNKHGSDANDVGGPIGESADDHAPKTPEEKIFDVSLPSGKNQAELFDVDEPEATDNHVPPIEFKDEVSVQDTKDVHKSSRVRIAGTSWKGQVLDEWEDLWGQKLVRVALSDGGTVNVAPTQIIADDPSQLAHPVTEIEKFISTFPEVEATRPSIMARLANLEIVRRAVRSQISKVGFSDQLKLEQIDLAAQDETRQLKNILPSIRTENDRGYLASQPKYRVGDGSQMQDPVFNEKIAERAAIFVSELEPEVREDSDALVYAAAKFAESNNGNVPEFVKAAHRYAFPGFQEDAEAQQHQQDLVQNELAGAGPFPSQGQGGEWATCPGCAGEDFSPDGRCLNCGTQQEPRAGDPRPNPRTHPEYWTE